MIGNNVSEGNKSATRRKKEKIISLTQRCHLSDQQGAFKAKQELFCLDPAGVSGEAVIRNARFLESDSTTSCSGRAILSHFEKSDPF